MTPLFWNGKDWPPPGGFPAFWKYINVELPLITGGDSPLVTRILTNLQKCGGFPSSTAIQNALGLMTLPYVRVDPGPTVIATVNEILVPQTYVDAYEQRRMNVGSLDKVVLGALCMWGAKNLKKSANPMAVTLFFLKAVWKADWLPIVTGAPGSLK
jgi:hypothetical protein